MRQTAPWLTGTTTIRITRTTISGSGLCAHEPRGMHLRIRGTSLASSGSNTAKFEWHLPAGTVLGKPEDVFWGKEEYAVNPD